jgi:integrase
MLTDTFVNSPRCVPKTGRVEWWDKRETGLALRVSANAHRSYIVVTRYPHSKQPARRSIDRLVGPPRDVEHAREICREWRRQVKAGIDPKAEHAKLVAAQLRVKKFGEVLDEWLTRDVDQNRTGKQTRQLMTREVPTHWLNRPTADLRREDIAKVIRGIVERDHRPTAHQFFGSLRRMFNWAIGTSEFGMDQSPMTSLSAGDLIGEKPTRDRVLRDEELVAVWKAADQCGYPFGDIVKLLILSGQRLNDIAQLNWSEIDFDKALITIPKERMKAKRAHIVPLAPMALSILKSISRQRGPYVFSTTNGHKPFGGFTRSTRLTNYVVSKAGCCMILGEASAPRSQPTRYRRL